MKKLVRAVALLIVVLTTSCSHHERAPLASAAQGPAAEVPPKASADPRVSAEAFVREYYDIAQSALLSRDGSLLAQLSAPHCPCRSLSKLADELRKKNLRYSSVEFADLRVTLEREDERTAVVAISYSHRPLDVVAADGKVVAKLQARRVVSKMVLIFRGDHWLVESNGGVL